MGTVAVLLATAGGDADGPAAVLPWEDGTVVGRLAEQLASLDIATAHVVTRPQWRPALERALAGAPLAVELHAPETTPEDLRTIAAIARGPGAAGLVVLPADILTHREALAGLLADPRLNTAALVSNGSAGRPFTFRAKSVRGRIVSAGSPYHDTHRSNTAFLGVLRVGPGDTAAAADVAEHMAALATPPLPESWTPTLRARVGRWRVSLARTAAAARGEDPAEIPGSDPQDPATEATLPLAPDAEAEMRRRLTGAEADAGALLLVGLVRSGMYVGNSYLRALFWARPLSPEAIAQARENIGRYDEDRVLLDSAVKANDGFFTTYFVSPYSKYIARWAARRGLTPNQITTFSLGLGIVAAALFATGERPGLVAGAIVAHLSFVFDCVDGQLARYTRTFSRLGAWLDSVFDRAKEYVMFAGLAIGAERMGDDVWLLAGAALALQSMRHTLEFSFGATRHRLAAEVPQPPAEQSLDAALARVRATAPQVREEHEEDALSPTPATPLRRILRLWRALNRIRGVLWIKKMIAFPIGERFAVIAITAAFFTPAVTFTVMLAWGGFAAAYTISGRVLRSVRR